MELGQWEASGGKAENALKWLCWEPTPSPREQPREDRGHKGAMEELGKKELAISTYLVGFLPSPGSRGP